MGGPSRRALGAVAGPLLVLALGAIPLWSAHLFGWIPADEGYLNSAAARFAAGQVPHRDYVERFPGALPAWNAAARWLFGETMAGPRRGLLLAGLLILLLLYGLARRALPFTAAALVALAASTWGVPRWFASNPTWYVLLFALAAGALLARGVGDPRGRWFLLAGVCGGFALAFKQTAGAYVVAALLAATALESVERFREGGPTASPLDRLAAVASAAVLPLVLTLALARRGGVYYPLLLVSAPAVVAIATIASAARGRLAPGAWSRGWRLAAGVLLGIAPLVLYYAAQGALGDAARGIFVLQWRSALRQFLPYHGLALGPPLLKLLVWIAGGALAGGLAGRWARAAPAIPLLHVAAAAIVSAGVGVDAIALAFREVAMFAPLGIASALAALVVRGARTGDAGLLALLTAAMFGVVYPLGAFLYAWYVAPLTVLSAAVLARRAYGVGVVSAVGVVALAGALVFPPGAKQSDGTPRPDRSTIALPGAGGDLRVPEDEGRAFLRIVEEIRKRVPPGGPIFCYPSDFGFYLMSGTENPTRHLFVDYYAGEEELREILAILDRRRVEVVVLRTYRPVEHPFREEFLAGLERRYRPAVHAPPFLLLERRPGS